MRLNVFRRRNSKAAKAPRQTGGRWYLAGLALFLGGFFISFYLAFPNQTLQQRLTAELDRHLPGQVALGDLELKPLFTLQTSSLTVRLPATGAELNFDQARFSPLWRGLLGGDPGIGGQLQKNDGQLNFDWQRSGVLQANGEDLAFELPLSKTAELSLSVRLVAGEVTTAAPLKKDSASRLKLTFDQVSISGLEAITASGESLQLGRLVLRSTGKGTTFTIDELRASGGELNVSGDGTLMLAPSRPERSRINLNLSLQVTPQTDPTLAGLLELAGTKQEDGSRKLRLTGTLAKPVIR